jgi:hypothetical protein
MGNTFTNLMSSAFSNCVLMLVHGLFYLLLKVLIDNMVTCSYSLGNSAFPSNKIDDVPCLDEFSFTSHIRNAISSPYSVPTRALCLFTVYFIVE